MIIIVVGHQAEPHKQTLMNEPGVQSAAHCIIPGRRTSTHPGLVEGHLDNTQIGIYRVAGHAEPVVLADVT
jgi:hypothetical protein